MTTKIHNPQGRTVPVQIAIDSEALHGDLRVEPNSLGIVIFVHGSGSSRFSPRNRYVAAELNKRGLATLLLDLLTEEEHRIDEETAQYRFDIPLLAGRSTLAATRRPPGGFCPAYLWGLGCGSSRVLLGWVGSVLVRQLRGIALAQGGKSCSRTS